MGSSLQGKEHIGREPPASCYDVPIASTKDRDGLDCCKWNLESCIMGGLKINTSRGGWFVPSNGRLLATVNVLLPSLCVTLFLFLSSAVNLLRV